MVKKEVYKWVKIAGLISFIPVMLSAGPLGGYFFGDFLEKKFSLPSYIIYISMGIGAIAGIRETVRIIRIVLNIDKKE